MKRIIFSCCLLVSISFKIYSQKSIAKSFENSEKAECALYGNVVDSKTKNPLEYSNVVLYRKQDSSLVTGCVTKANGKFSIKDIPFDEYYLKISFLGYTDKSINSIKFSKENKTIKLDQVFLNPSGINASEMNVSAERSPIEYHIDKKVVNVSQQLAASGGMAVEILKNVPSIQIDIEGNVNLRGSSNFKVLIDGKPTILQGSDVLKQTPASVVERVEIITNPSAKYEPDGTSGIINIIMKKQGVDGFNGIINASVGSYDNYNGDFLINYRKKGVKVFLGANYNHNAYPATSSTDRNTYFSDTTNYLSTETDRLMVRYGYKINGGLDYYLNSANTLSIAFDLGLWGFDRIFEFSNHNWREYDTVEVFKISEDDYRITGDYRNAHLTYKHDFKQKGHNLLFSGYYGYWVGKINQNNEEFLTNENWQIINNQPYQVQTFTDNIIQGIRFKIDYAKPIGKKGKFEAGYSWRLRSNNSEFEYEKFDTAKSEWEEDSLIGNESDFTRYVQAIYGTFSNEILGFKYKLGLRVEHTDRTIESFTSNKEYRIERFDYFPTIHISRKFLEKNQLQLSYSRRINRPQDYYLNPFPDYSDEYYVSEGNPELGPEYINSYELNYHRWFKKASISAEVYFKNTNNSISRVLTRYDESRILLTYDNVNNAYAYGVELGANLKVIKWWQLYTSANLYKYELQDNLSGRELTTSSNNWNIKINSIFNLSKSTRMQLSGYYSGPSVTLQGRTAEFFTTSIALKQELFKRKLSLSLSVRDILRSQKYVYINDDENFYSKTDYISKAPVIRFSISYRINNYRKTHNQRESIEGGFDGGGMN